MFYNIFSDPFNKVITIYDPFTVGEDVIVNMSSSMSSSHVGIFYTTENEDNDKIWELIRAKRNQILLLSSFSFLIIFVYLANLFT